MCQIGEDEPWEETMLIGQDALEWGFERGRPEDRSSSPRLESSDGTDDDVVSSEEVDTASKQDELRTPVHRINAPGSVQALAVDDDVLFAGVQGGGIVAWSLDTFERLANVNAHKESVLGLALSEDSSLLFSSGADSVVNVWSTQTLKRLYSLCSPFEIGDVFCVSHSTKRQTLFWGAQNSSIQWYQFSAGKTFRSPTTSPGSRKHRFFDSLGPGGTANAIYDEEGSELSEGGQVLTIPARNYAPYAHKSYIYASHLIKGLFQHDREEEALVTGAGDGTIKVWSIEDLSRRGLVPLMKFKNEDQSVISLTYRGSFLYAGLSDGVAHIYNLASSQLVQRLQIGHGHISSINLSSDLLVCGTSQGWIKCFDNHFAETAAWHANDGKVLAINSSTANGREILIAGANNSVVTFWDCADGFRANKDTSAYSKDELVNCLREFVAFRSVALNPACVRDCHDAVNFLRKKCSAFGASTTLISPQEGVNPILLAKFRASKPTRSTKTVLFYGHYDVVDAEYSLSGSNPVWHGEPFSVQPLNGYLYGRGVTDNKGPIVAAIYAVSDLVSKSSLSCNVTFLLEGDEEAGSRGFRTAVQAHHDKIGPVDFVLLSNSYWLDDHIPCLTFGMRGVVHASVSITSNKPDLHSGMDGKSVQHEPLKDLTILLAHLIGPSGTKVTIPHFYDAVDPLTEAELQAYASITSALLPGHPEIKNAQSFANSLMQRWRYPNLTVHRIEVPEAKTAVTISGSAKATLSIRIVPSQTAEEIAAGLEAHLHAEFDKLKSSNQLTVGITSRADPWLGNIHSEIYTALQRAVTDVWKPTVSSRSFPVLSMPPLGTSPVSVFSASSSSGTNASSPPQQQPLPPPPQRTSSHRRASSLLPSSSFPPSLDPLEPLFIREGGSIPAISFLEKEFGAPAAMLPMGQASDNAHLDNERIRLENLYRGRNVLAAVFAAL